MSVHVLLNLSTLFEKMIKCLAAKYFTAIFCLLFKLSTVKAIWLKLHTILEHNETMCHAQEL